MQKTEDLKSEASQDESGSESEDLQHSDVEEGEDHTHEECDDDMVRQIQACYTNNGNNIVGSGDKKECVLKIKKNQQKQWRCTSW